MSTTTLERPTQVRPTEQTHSTTVDRRHERVNFARVMQSEWIKFRTLRSSWYSLAAAILSLVGIGLVVGYLTSTGNWATLDAEDQVASAPLQGYRLAQLLIGMLGVLFVTGEYATGMIHSTFAAVPRRLPVLGAKSVVFGTLALVVMTVSSFVTFFGAQVFLSSHDHGTSIAQGDVIRVVAGVGVYMGLIGLLGVALGWIIRSTAGAIGALVGILFVIPLMGALFGSTVEKAVRYLPGNAGESFISTLSAPNTLGPWTGLAVLVAWVAAALVVAAVVVCRRDA